MTFEETVLHTDAVKWAASALHGTEFNGPDFIESRRLGFLEGFRYKIRGRCPCGGIILADTEDWKIPMCHECAHPFIHLIGLVSWLVKTVPSRRVYLKAIRSAFESFNATVRKP